MTAEKNTEELIQSAQAGTRSARDELITRFTPFIIKTVSKVCGRFVRMGEDDEVSIGLMAFDEAILSYCGKSGGSFMSYCELVIKHRLIDFFRKKRRQENLLVELKDDELIAKDDIAGLIFREDMRREIVNLSSELKIFDITFKELTECSPKHKETRQNAITVAINIAANPNMLSVLRKKKYLPQKDITENFNVSTKLLERFRKYIIAVVLIFSGNYEGMQNFIKGGVGYESSAHSSRMRVGDQ